MLKNVVVVEGIDGCGKGIIVEELARIAASRGLKVFDVRRHQQEYDAHPGFGEFGRADVLVSAEPSFAGVGRQIRGKLIRKDSVQAPMSIARAYADDRKELHEKIIIPASKEGKLVFQERSVASSLVYQPVHAKFNSLASPTREEVMALPGNVFCLDNVPEFLIIAKVSAETGMKRLGKRDKKDDCQFERLQFQRAVRRAYEGDWLKQLFESRGTKVCYIDTDEPKTIADTRKAASEFYEKYFGWLFRA